MTTPTPEAAAKFATFKAKVIRSTARLCQISQARAAELIEASNLELSHGFCYRPIDIARQIKASEVSA